MRLTIPAQLERACRHTPERARWLAALPDVVDELAARWSLTVAQPFDGADVSCAWVAPAWRAAETPAVLKVGMPHLEGEREIEGLRFWNGDPTVYLLEADDQLGAMLLERCDWRTPLRHEPEPQQDVVLAGLLRRLWRMPSQPHAFRPLSAMLRQWSRETRALAARWPDAGLVRSGLALFDELARTTTTEALLATDLHAGNVLRAEREPWLVIDPKPFVGDPAYDATQHLLNCRRRLRDDARDTIRRFADSLELDHERVRLWVFARTAAEPRDDWMEDDRMDVARILAP